MTSRLAYDEITLAHGDIIVCLRPSLRAATTLERSHDGFATLFRRLDELHVGTLYEIITAAATDRKDGSAFLKAIDALPLQQFAALTQRPLTALCLGFLPKADPDAKPSPNAKPIAWPTFYRELFRTATGWLHWTPQATWNATPTEISEALAGHVAMLKAMHSATDTDDAPAPAQPDLDAQLDRDGLNRLRGKGRLR